MLTSKYCIRGLKSAYLLILIIVFFLITYYHLPYPAAVMPSSPLRIAVLECDTPQPRCNERYGGYGGLFKELLLDGTEAYAKETGNSKPTLEVTKYNVVNEEVYPNLDDIDAILISGSSTSPSPFPIRPTN